MNEPKTAESGARATGRDDIPRIADAFARELARILGKNLHSAVINGAAAFPDTLPTGDIDFHVLLHRTLTNAERTALEAMHRALAKRFPPHEYPNYCTLNLCRLAYSFETRDVVISRAGAARWALDALPNWRDAIHLTVASYEGRASEADRTSTVEKMERLLADARRRIDGRTVD